MWRWIQCEACWFILYVTDIRYFNSKNILRNNFFVSWKNVFSFIFTWLCSLFFTLVYMFIHYLYVYTCSCPILMNCGKFRTGSWSIWCWKGTTFVISSETITPTLGKKVRARLSELKGGRLIVMRKKLYFPSHCQQGNSIIQCWVHTMTVAQCGSRDLKIHCL